MGKVPEQRAGDTDLTFFLSPEKAEERPQRKGSSMAGWSHWAFVWDTISACRTMSL